MTNSTHTVEETVAVIQADLAAAVAAAHANCMAIFEGKGQGVEVLAQAFARHRLASHSTPAGEDVERACQWQPIETAPKDGTRILLWLGDPWSEGEVASWYEPWGNWQTDRHFSPISEADEYSGIGAKVPTHWMPLPKPPAALTKMGEKL